MRPTLVFIGPRQIGDRQFSHGEELPDDLLSQEQIDEMLDQRLLANYPERRSLYRIFAVFSGYNERQPLQQQELESYALTD
jgi:hypothetical protein